MRPLFLRERHFSPLSYEEFLMALSAAFDAQVNRLAAYVTALKAAGTVVDTGPAVDAEATAALAAQLDAEGAPSAEAPAAPAV